MYPEQITEVSARGDRSAATPPRIVVQVELPQLAQEVRPLSGDSS